MRNLYTIVSKGERLERWRLRRRRRLWQKVVIIICSSNIIIWLLVLAEVGNAQSSASEPQATERPDSNSSSPSQNSPSSQVQVSTSSNSSNVAMYQEPKKNLTDDESLQVSSEPSNQFEPQAEVITGQNLNLNQNQSGQSAELLLVAGGVVQELNAFQAAQHGYFRHSVSVSVLLTIAYTIVFVVGIVGNSFVVAIVCKSPRMRTVTNYFIANLAFADILVLLFCLPATLVGNLFIRK